MAEFATIARPYAEALFKSCRDDLAGTQGWLDGLALAGSHDELLQFAANPKARENQVFDLVSSVLGTALPTRAANFLRTVIDNGRIAALPEVAAQFRALVNSRNGSSDAIVHSAFPMEPSALTELSAALEKRFGRKLNLSVQLDPSLIGGVRVVVGDEVLDTSVKARLEQMKAALIA